MAFPFAEARDSQWTQEKIACLACHEDLSKQFRGTAHGRALEFGRWKQAQCQSCHAGAEKHIQSADPKDVQNPAKLAGAQKSETCLKCHGAEKHSTYWRGSAHETANLNCLSCHSVHHAAGANHLLIKKTETETCLSCHAQVRKAMFQRSTHLYRDERGTGLVQCAACHNPHGAPGEKLISANSVNEKCFACHQEKRGPFLWEHAPVRENCMTCHSPHGSNNPQLLAMRMPQLCQSCHMQGRHQTVAGRPNALFNINRQCLNCHSQIHGTNHPSGVIMMR